MNKFQPLVRAKSDEELLINIYEFNQWDDEMLQAVEEELTKRKLLPADVVTRKKEMIDREADVLEVGRQASFAGQLFGWLGVLGMIGLVIGYNYAFARQTSKYTGKKYYKYDAASRQNGSYIFYTAISIFILYFFYLLVTRTGNGF